MNIKRFLMSILLLMTVVNTAYIIGRDGCAKGWRKKKGICVKDKPCAKGWYSKNGICLKKNANNIDSYFGCAPGWHKKNGICVQKPKQRIRILNNYGTHVLVHMQWIDQYGAHTTQFTDTTIKSGEEQVIAGPLSGYKLRHLDVTPSTSGLAITILKTTNKDGKRVHGNRYFVISEKDSTSFVGQRKIMLTGYKDKAAYKAGLVTNEEKSTDKEFFKEEIIEENDLSELESELSTEESFDEENLATA